MSPGGVGYLEDFSSSGSSATKPSVVSSRPAMLEAFCRAIRTTLVGSRIPDLKNILQLHPIAFHQLLGLSSPTMG